MQPARQSLIRKQQTSEFGKSEKVESQTVLNEKVVNAKILKEKVARFTISIKSGKSGTFELKSSKFR